LSATILLVEDEPAIADTIAYALRLQGYEVAKSSTGEEALERLRSERVDCMVLDVGLPDQSGFELCKLVRAWSTVPIIFVTARSDEVDRVVGLEIGGDDYVVKPFSPRELAARVKALLRRSATAGGTSGGSPRGDAPTPFSVDRDRMEIAYFGTPLSLSRYEFRILEILVGRPGWVFSRERLMALAWEEPEASLSRTVDSHIKAIRAKLRGVTPASDPIRTHRGLGYSLRESW
jgi:two-component system catabolic regulation response regulator CreB